MNIRKKTSSVFLMFCLCLSATIIANAYSNSDNSKFSKFNIESHSNSIFKFQTKRKKKKSKVSKNLIRGPKGGCYYKNRNGRKTYVSRSLCR